MQENIIYKCYNHKYENYFNFVIGNDMKINIPKEVAFVINTILSTDDAYIVGGW